MLIYDENLEKGVDTMVKEVDNGSHDEQNRGITDTDMLDWLNDHLSAFRYGFSESECELEWIDHQGYTKIVKGLNLRDCIRGAVAGESTPK